MTAEKKQWYYADDETGQWAGPMSLGDLDGLNAAGKVNDFTSVANTQMLRQGGPGGMSGVPYSMISRLNVDFVPTVEEFHAARTDKSITVLSGPNNGGTTLLLKQLCYLVGHDGYLMACNRFSHVDVLNTRERNAHEDRRYYDNFMHSFHTSRQNTEDNELKLQQVITGLKDGQRDKLFSVAKELLGNEFSLKRTDAENTFSPFYVDMDGENLCYGSSGTRLLLTLLGILLDERFSTILIDEPEIGLSPRIQAVLARFLYDEERRQEFCHHLRQIYIATHSHLFLDRRIFSNNHTVTKAGNVVSVKQVDSFGAFHQLQFNMLGNELESIFLPSSIVIVEGDTDVTFMTRVVQMHIPDRKIAVVRAGGDGEVQNKLNLLKEAFGDLATSPYCDRLFVVLDARHSVSSRRIENQGIPGENITVWSKNGIEHYYPQQLVAEAFCCDAAELANGTLESDPIEINAIRKSKKQLAQFVTDRLTTSHPLHAELKVLLDRIHAACKSE